MPTRGAVLHWPRVIEPVARLFRGEALLGDAKVTPSKSVESV